MLNVFQITAIEEEEVRNLRCLVADLSHQYSYFTEVREERDNLRDQLTQSTIDLGNQIEEVTHEKNCLMVY